VLVKQALLFTYRQKWSLAVSKRSCLWQ